MPVWPLWMIVSLMLLALIELIIGYALGRGPKVKPSKTRDLDNAGSEHLGGGEDRGHS